MTNFACIFLAFCGLSGICLVTSSLIEVVGPNETIIESENFGSSERYPNNLDQKYLIRGHAPNYIILLQFLNFSLEKDADYLRIQEKIGDTVVSIKKTGSQRSFNYTTTTNSVRLRFTTSPSNQRNGFRIRVTFINILTHCDIRILQRDYQEQDLTCTNLIANRSSECRVFREGVMDINKTCREGRWISTSLTFNETILQECEVDWDAENCSFTADDVADYYGLVGSEGLPDDPIDEIDEDEIDSSRFRRSPNCSSRGLCRLKWKDRKLVYTQPENCSHFLRRPNLSRLRARYWARTCYQCRNGNCITRGLSFAFKPNQNGRNRKGRKNILMLE